TLAATAAKPAMAATLAAIASPRPRPRPRPRRSRVLWPGCCSPRSSSTRIAPALMIGGPSHQTGAELWIGLPHRRRDGFDRRLLLAATGRRRADRVEEPGNRLAPFFE